MGRLTFWFLLGLTLFAVSSNDVLASGGSDIGPSESECRPYIEKAINELKTGEPSDRANVHSPDSNSGEDITNNLPDNDDNGDDEEMQQDQPPAATKDDNDAENDNDDDNDDDDDDDGDDDDDKSKHSKTAEVTDDNDDDNADDDDGDNDDDDDEKSVEEPQSTKKSIEKLSKEVDTDGDGIPNEEDSDIDGDVIPNEEDDDMDGDGILNIHDDDIDGDIIPNHKDPDMDGDGVLNVHDKDIDGDGVPNVHDNDLDGDGIPNDKDDDMDGDGIPNDEDDDMDGDGIPNSQDSDIDGDGIPNEQDDDIDGDGIPNADDDDMDGDGIPNEDDEDIDGDGIPNEDDEDIDGDGVHNEEDTDIDGDGIVNADDEDLDGDGIANDADVDIDGDGITNPKDDDIDGDGIVNKEDKDMDGDGVLDHQDDDIDSDGIPNEKDDDFDGDGIPNEHDDDDDLKLVAADESKEEKKEEAPKRSKRSVDAAPLLTSKQGDIDGDGIPDHEDSDRDGDGVPDHQDDDIDGDGIPNQEDGDKDGDGIPNEHDEDSKAEESEEDTKPEDELLWEGEIPENLRSRKHINELLQLDDEYSPKEKAVDRVAEIVLRDIKRIYENAIKPLETLYKYRDLSNRHFGDPEIFSKPLVLFMGPWSGGKSSIINYLTGNEYTPNSLRTGAEPSPAYFNILMWGNETEVLDGTQLAADYTFSGLQKFGQGLEDRLRGLKMPSKLLEKVNIVEIPGILEVRKQVSRLFPFNDACQWFIDRADIIFLVYDPAKLDVGPETEAILDQLKGREYQTRIVLNKADTVKPEELLRVQSALIWNISPLMSSAQPPLVYTTSLWSNPLQSGSPARLLLAQERAFLRDMRTAIEKRIEHKIASARRFAVRVRNHAKMVDCYLNTFYNHKTLFGNKKRIAETIITHPENYHIYEGLSTLTNISRYDLPDPEVYRDFFRLNPLYEFKKLSDTCTYFRGCPITKLDVAIAYELPELAGKYKKMAESALAGIEAEGAGTEPLTGKASSQGQKDKS